MGNISYVSLSYASALERSLDATAHNLSNASTAGYKAFRPVFETVDAEAETVGGDAISYVQDRGSYLDATQGAIMPTGNPLDLAVSGNGWFGFEVDGEQAYGRNGRLVVDVNGRLTTASGHALMDAGGAPIILPNDVGQDITIAPDGTISGPDGAVLGRVGLYDIQADALMHPIGQGLYISPLGVEAAQPAENSRVAQGFVESSNVEPVIEMTRMIDIQRAYENSLRLIGEEDDLTKQAIQRLGRV
ncbi:flagellar hook basal-body protein [Shimia sp. CNT1-13L.2]|jgi:flagellar basal-body rod protein FlgF|uniref:flagellar hook basal-body protein n=1 Tax=Shimia sp. CNT1-13L.2 TaxID=2959663 RepID=UPI0020CC433F|nr:flagellar hook basal-body protein [Shimia sp. CNT1-13L.2]MCP9481057.1 flagellar hook basal-body protein [Shimia sp. CNT1-13L.2]